MTGLSVALAPPVPSRSWQRPLRVALVAGALLAFLVVATASSMSEQDVAGLKLFGTVGVVVVVFAGFTALARRRAHDRFGAAHTAAATAWRQAKFCKQCGASWVPGDHHTVGQDRVLGQVLLRRAKADLARGQG